MAIRLAKPATRGGNTRAPLFTECAALPATSPVIDELRHEAIEAGLVAAVETGETPIIFDWLMSILSYQGISDAVARGFMDQHGNVTWAEIKRALDRDPECKKLQGYWAFTRCQYRKDFADLCGANQFWQLPPAPSQPTERPAQPNRVQPVSFYS